jgi:very-short-patch-repair endonuclease
MGPGSLQLWYSINGRSLGVRFRRFYFVREADWIPTFICVERKFAIEVSDIIDLSTLCEDAKHLRMGYKVIRFRDADLLSNLYGALRLVNILLHGSDDIGGSERAQHQA